MGASDSPHFLCLITSRSVVMVSEHRVQRSTMLVADVAPSLAEPG